MEAGTPPALGAEVPTTGPPGSPGTCVLFALVSPVLTEEPGALQVLRKAFVKQMNK